MAIDQAYLLKKFPRLSETFVLGEILAQEELGADMHIFSRRSADDEPRHPQLARLKAEIEVLPSGRAIDPWRTIFPPGGEVRQEILKGIAECVEAVRELNVPRFPMLLAEALWLLDRTRELGIRHLHVHFATESAVTAMLLCTLGGPSYSITAHAKDIYRETVDPRLLSALIERSQFTVTVCDANVRHINSKVSSLASSKVRRLYNGVDLTRLPYRRGELDSEEILAVGRLVPKKGFDVLLDSLAELKSQGRTFHATIIGDGDEKSALLEQSVRLGLEQRVTFTGPLDQDGVRAAMERATVFCLPCLIGEDGNRDALPTVLLEALSLGIPTISTPVTGIPEILDDGRAGLLVPQRDAGSTARALARMLDDASLRRTFSELGRARAVELFDSKRAAETLHRWFQEVLEVQSCADASST